MDRIILRGLEFYGYHGVLPAEKELGQRFQLDLELGLDLRPAGEKDDLGKTVNYAAVFELVQEVTTREKYDLIEALAEKIAGEILSRFPVQTVKVLVRKPQAPIPGKFKFVGVEIFRERSCR